MISERLKPPPGCPSDSIVLSFPVPRELSGQRLDRFIQLRIPRLSRTRAQAIVRECAYRADGTKRRPSDLVREGETVLLVRPTFEEPETPQDFGVVYEDEALYVVHKPAGLPVHPTATYHRNTLTYMLRERFGPGAPQITHRLDRETSGLLVCAKTIADERIVKFAFESRKVQKSYLAIVFGEMDDEGLIALPLAPVKSGLHLLMEVRDEGDGSLAETQYRVRARQHQRSLVELSPKTGRQHQLRVHLAAVGHPIVGDKLYGPEKEAPFLEYIETGMTPTLKARLGHHRQALHAHTITFDHPRTGLPITLSADLADDLQTLWDSPPSR
ncbi:MAG: RluA family pseudouridine synthase [Sandaracinaceae bacterium]|nr:RluA family pseudouridine synthase [Sandaracinaceae bacterium]